LTVEAAVVRNTPYDGIGAAKPLETLRSKRFGANLYLPDRHVRCGSGDDAVYFGQAVGKMRDVFRLRKMIECEDRAVAARIALDADRSYRDKPALVELLDWSIRLCGQTADRQGRAGEGVALQKLTGQAQFAADLPNLIFVEEAEGFNNAARLDQLLNPFDAVVVCFDEIGFFAATGFDRVGIDGALSQNPLGVEKVPPTCSKPTTWRRRSSKP
jgi:hypothetical protein